jgi:hypothetical protein
MLETLFGQTYLKGELVNVRNRFSHFNMLQGNTPALNLTQEINQARQLMAYDRKLKNAVSKSIGGFKDEVQHGLTRRETPRGAS